MENILEDIHEKIEQASGLYYRLVLLVAPAGAGKTAALRKVQTRLAVPLINVDLDISRLMLELTTRRRAFQVAQILEKILRDSDCEVVLFDNLEILFEVSLKLDPLRLLQGLSRNRTVVAAWNGEIKEHSLTYAAPGHPEYKRYPIRDFLLVTLKSDS